MPAPLGPGRAAVLGRPRSFLPTDLPGLVLWLAADKITGLSDGDPVTTWVDASGSGNDATQATAAKKPTWIESGLNGKAVVRFDGVDDVLQTASALVSGSQARTLFVVYQHQAIGNYVYSITGQYAEAVVGTTWMMMARFDGTDPFLMGYGADLSGSGLDGGTAKLGAATYDGTTGVLYKNGTQVNAQPRTWNTTAEGWRLGNNGPFGEYLNGDVAEVILNIGALGSSDLQRTSTYLNQKWALY